MKVFCGFLIVFSVLFTTGFGQVSTKSSGSNKRQSEARWKYYGDKLTMQKPNLLTKKLLHDQASRDKEMLVEGVISEVCQNKGCWMVVGSGGGQVRVEFKGYKFFVPWDSEKKKVKMQGMLKSKTIDKQTAEHMAGEMKNPPAVSRDNENEQSIEVFEASGVAILDGSEMSQEQKDIIEGKKEKEGHQHEGHDQ